MPAEAVHNFVRRHPELRPVDVDLVKQGLLEWYRVMLRAGTRAAVIPSSIVSDMWAEHAALSNEYAAFCKRCFGRSRRFVAPQVHVVGTVGDIAYRELLRDTWKFANKTHEGNGLPLIFGIDELLGVPDGRRYVEDCGTQVCSADRAFCFKHLPKRKYDDYDANRN